mgnify:CR=1 FL=1
MLPLLTLVPLLASHDTRLAGALGLAAVKAAAALVVILAEGGLTTRWADVRRAIGPGIALSTVGELADLHRVRPAAQVVALARNAHQAAHRLHLEHQLALAGTTNRRVARHTAHRGRVADQQGHAGKLCSGPRGFQARVPAADHDYIPAAHHSWAV